MVAGLERFASRLPARRRLCAVGPALVCVAVLLAACGGGGSSSQSTPVAPIDGELAVEGFEWGFGPPSIVLRQGDEVTFRFENTGTILHNLRIDGLDAEGVASESTGPLQGGEGELFVGAEAGQRGTLTFTPLAAGTYTYYCTVSGHRNLGMEGVLTVE